MEVNYSIQADIIDIQSDIPQEGDRFFVDTNVWFWLTYSSASSSALPYQIASYPSYVQNAFTQGSGILYSGLTLSELAHLIEKKEHELSSYSSVKPKVYRHNYPSERSYVVSELQAAWGQVSQFAMLACSIDDSTVNAAMTRFETQALDGYDLFILETMQNHSITQVITDDGDYATVPGIQVFTANRSVIQAARQQNKLVTR